MGLHMGSASLTSGGTDVLADTWIQDSEDWRRVSWVALGGSNAAGDCYFSLYYGDKLVAKLYPSSVGAVYPDDDDKQVISSKKLCPPHTLIKLVPNVNPTTNIVYFVIDVQDLPSYQQGTFGRGSQGCGRWTESYASQALDANLAVGKDWYKANRPRRISQIAWVGGAAAQDCAIDVSYGTKQVAHLINFFTGAPDKLKVHWMTSRLKCPANVPINVKVTDATTSTATFLVMDVKEA